MSGKKSDEISLKTKIYRWLIELDRKIEIWVQHSIEQIDSEQKEMNNEKRDWVHSPFSTEKPRSIPK